MFSLRPGEGGKIDLGNVLVDAGAFSLNTSTSRIYTAENLTLSAGPATGTGGHVEVVQPRGTAYLDLLSGDGSTASGAQINLKSSGPRRRGAGDYTVAVTEDGAFAITVGRPASSKLARFEVARPVKPWEVEVINSFNISANETGYFCAAAEWWGWAEAPRLNETWLALNESSFVSGILAQANATSGLSSDTNASSANVTTEGKMEYEVESFFYTFQNRSYLCLEKQNQTYTTIGETVSYWVDKTPQSRVALSMFQLYFAANETLPSYEGEEQVAINQGERRRRRQMQEAEQESLFQFGELATAMGALNTSSWGAPGGWGENETNMYIQDVYSQIEADADVALLTITREHGAVPAVETDLAVDASLLE